MAQTSKTQEKVEVTKSSVTPRFGKRLLEKFGDRARAKMSALKATALALGIGVMVSCTPASVNAQDTLNRSPKEPAAKVEKADVEYQILSDAKELEPYFKNAKGKMVTLKPGQTKKIGEYEVKIFSEGSTGVDFKVTVKGKEQLQGVVFASPLSEVNILAIDMGENHPMIKGTLLVFADNTTVYFQFFDKQLGAHSLAGVPLEKGRMREGPIRTGFGIDDDGVFVLNAPKDLKAGDVVCQAGLWNDGSSGAGWFKFIPPSEGSKTVAMR